MSGDDRDEDADRLSAGVRAGDDPTAWFERLYAEAERGAAVVPWDRGGPNPRLAAWAQAQRPDGRGRRALVVGAGFGDDAELVAGLAFATVAFDISPTAVAGARGRHPGSAVRYVVADVLDPPDEWLGAFDLVVESLTVQSLPDPPRPRAIANVAALVAPGGTLLVIASAREADEAVSGPPWPLTRAEIDAFAVRGLAPVRIEDLRDAGLRWWRVELRRPAS